MKLRIKPKTKSKTKFDRLYKTVLFNDDQTPFDFVLELLKTTYKLTQTKAMLRTLRSHHDGRSVIIIAPLEISELRLEQAVSAIKKARHRLKIEIQPN